MCAPPSLGALADRVARREPTGPLTLMAVVSALALAAGGLWLFAPVLPLVVGGYLVHDFLRSAYPAGILIGTVARVDTGTSPLARIIHIAPAAPLDKLTDVQVLTRPQSR